MTRSKPALNWRRLGRLMLRTLGVGFGVTVVVFAIVRFVPGDPVTVLLGELATPEEVARMEEQLGLSGSIWEQAVDYFSGLLRGDLGSSIFSGLPVTEIIGTSIVPTLALIVVASIFGVVMSLPAGVFMALKPKSILTTGLKFLMTVALSIPGFFLGLLALLVFAVDLDIAPIAGFTYEFPEMLAYLWLPALVIVVGNLLPVLARVIEASATSTLSEEFVEVARVRGTPRFRFLWHYVVRPSIAPTIALFSYLIVAMVGASVVVELIFDIPGIGLQLIRAVTIRDYPVIQGILLVFGMIAVVVTAVADVTAAAIDPRISDSARNA